MAGEKDKKNKFQQRMDEQAAAMEKAYAELRETYEDPTDEQILAVAGNNLRGYQKKMGNKAGNWGTAFGSNALWGTLNKDTRAALEEGYQAGLKAKKKPLTDRRAESLYTLGEGEGAKKVTRGMRMDARNWGDNITDTDNITPEQVRKLNEIMTSGGFTNFTIPTQQVTTKNEKGEDVTTDVEQNISLYDLLESASPEEIEALEYLGFVDEDGAYVRPHNETFEEKLARKERERERIDMLTQQKALQRQQARLGLADLAAGIGDMIKASGGAIVNPRDYRAMYDSLTEQQKTNYNNYLARMQALKEQEKAKRKEAADRAYQEKLLKEQERQKYEMLLAQHKLDLELQEKKANDALELQGLKGAQAMERLQKNIEASYTKQEKAALDKGNSIYFDNSIHVLEPNKTNQVYGGVYGILLPYLMNNPFFSSALSGIEDPYAEKSASKVATAVQAAIKNKEVMSKLSDSEKQEIRDLINLGVKGRPISAGASGGASAAASSATKKYKAPNGTIITQEQYNGLSQAQKDKCVEVTE